MKRIQHRIVVSLLLLALALLVSACVSSPDSAKDNEQAVAAVRAVIEAQQAAWNRGDIEGFMDGYERAETTTFVPSKSITLGVILSPSALMSVLGRPMSSSTETTENVVPKSMPTAGILVRFIPLI